MLRSVGEISSPWALKGIRAKADIARDRFAVTRLIIIDVFLDIVLVGLKIKGDATFVCNVKNKILSFWAK